MVRVASGNCTEVQEGIAIALRNVVARRAIEPCAGARVAGGADQEAGARSVGDADSTPHIGTGCSLDTPSVQPDAWPGRILQTLRGCVQRSRGTGDSGASDLQDHVSGNAA